MMGQEESRKRDARRDRASRFKKSLEKSGDLTKARKADKDVLRAFRDISVCFGVNTAHVGRMWKESDNPVDDLKYFYRGSGIEKVFVHTRSTVKSIGDILKPAFVESLIWSSLIENCDKVKTPIIIFMVKNNGLWVLTTYKAARTSALSAKITFSAYGVNDDPYVCPLEVFIAENKEK